MPKRVKTPPPPDDEPRYLAIHHPFGTTEDGGRCSMALPQHQRDFARWVACCIDQEVFLAFYYRPSSGDVVVIEVKRDYPHLDHILGEHRWSEFLINPPADVKNDVSRVYYCTYHSGRELQKHGWKCVPLEDDWFRTWSPKNKFIKFPYPYTHFCDLPQGIDRTIQSLFRPLPTAVKAPPPEILAAPPPVVGSSEWLQAKRHPDAPPSGPKTKATGSVWSKGIPKSRGQQAAKITQVNIPGGKKPAAGGGHAVAKASTVWQAPNSLTGFNSSWDNQSIMSFSSEISGKKSPIAEGANTLPGLTPPPGSTPPGLGPPPGLAPLPPRSVWSKGPPSTSGPAVNVWGPPPGLGSARLANSSSNGMDHSPNPYAVQVPMPDGMADALSRQLTLNDENGKPRGVDGYGYDEEDDDDELADMGVLMSGAQGVVHGSSPSLVSSGHDGSGVPQDNNDDDHVWGLKPGDDAEAYARRASPAQSNASGESGGNEGWAKLSSVSGVNDDDLCPAHGKLCTKGICREYAEKKRKKQWAEERAQRADAAGRGRGRGSGRGWRGSGIADRDRGGRGNDMYKGRGALVKTNWKGAPRELKDLNAALEEESAMSRAEGTDIGNDSDNLWNAVPSADWDPLPTTSTPDDTSDLDVDKSNATTESHGRSTSPAPDVGLETQAKGKGKGTAGVKVAKGSWKNAKKAQDQKQSQPQTTAKTQFKNQNQIQKPSKGSWADQVEDASAAGWDDAKSGWGTVSEGPWS